MTGTDEVRRLREVGFAESEITQWADSRRKDLADAGFRQDEIDGYFGFPHFDDKPVRAYVNEALQQASQGDGTSQPKPVESLDEAILYGLQASSTGLMLRGKRPDQILPEDAPRILGIASNVLSLFGDTPNIAAGFVLGGGPASPITGVAGAFALPAGIRTILMDKYTKGEVTTFSEFWDRFSSAFLETSKAWVTGAATAGVGAAAKALPIQSPFMKGATVTAAEISTMVSVGKGLEGQVPEPDDFINAALTLGFVKGTTRATAKLMDIYAKTGRTPGQVVEDTKKIPSILQDLTSSNFDIPRAYDITLRQAPLPVKVAPRTERPPSDGALGKIGDHISTSPQQEHPLTWQDLYTKAVDDLNPIREAVKKAERVTGRKLDGPEQAQGEIVPEGQLRDRPLLAGETKAALEGPQGQFLEEIKRGDVALSGEFVRTRTDAVTGKPEDASGLADPYKLMRLQRGSTGKATHFLEHGTVDFKTFETNGESLRDIIKPITDMDGFRNFIVAQRATELHGRGIESGIDHALAKSAVTEGASRFKNDADRLVQYQNRVTKYLRDAGVISREQYDAMLEANQFYVPFFRLLSAQGGPGGGVTVRNPIKAIEGSEKMILDPLESVIKNTYIYTAIAERNAAGAAFIKMADKTGDAKLFYRTVPPETMKIDLTEPEIRRLFREFVQVVKVESERKATTETRGGSTTTRSETASASSGESPSRAFQMVRDRVSEALQARGFSDGEASQMIERLMAKSDKPSSKTETITETVERVSKIVEKTVFEPALNIRLPHEAAAVFRAIRAPLRDNEIAVFENGKRQVYSLDGDVAAAFKSLDAETANLFVKIIAIPARTLRAGAVLSPDFMARNALRDQLSAFTLSKGGYYPVFDFVRGALSLIKKDEDFGNWLKAGGANSAMVSVDRQYLQEHLFKLSKETGLMERAWNVVKSPLEGLRIASELVENSTRLGEFTRVARKTGTDKAGLQEAAFASREVTLDFARIGANMRAVNMISAFTNAQVQGLDRVIRGFGENPIGMSAKIGLSITMPSLLLWWANHDDPRWQEVPRWQKDLFWIVMTDEHVYRIPKPFELGLIFGSLPERALEQYFTDNPNALKEFERSMVEALTPSLTPQIAQPIIEQFSNRSLFTGTPIIPYRAEKLLPEYQYNEYTTELAKALGSLIGSFPGMQDRALRDDQTILGGAARALSTPAMIENYVRAWTGGLGAYALQLADKALREAGALPSPVRPAWAIADVPIIKAFVVRYPSASAQSIRDFYENYDVSERRYKTFSDLAEKGDPRAFSIVEAHTESLAQLTGMRSVLDDSARLIRMIHDNPEQAPDEKRQLIDMQYYRMIEVARAGNAMMQQLAR